MLKLTPVHLSRRPCTITDANGGGPRTWRLAEIDCPHCSRSAAGLAVIRERVGELLVCALGLALVTLACAL